ncbi:ras-related protein Rab-37-like isoform X2 [Mytilus galloprovincialis]|uniref:ras-related protein Rab-37-like isoform X2 n=1 Tax=Mytilus galloprovincialis TaxID=29158 RepID=UPI003F7C7FB0
MADKGTSGPGLKVIANGRTSPNTEAYDENTIHKTILVGDSGVGKTSLLVQFDQGKFQAGSFSATVGIGFTNKVVDVEGTKVKLQIWDTAGQERFRSVTHAYYRDAHGISLMYLTSPFYMFSHFSAFLLNMFICCFTDEEHDSIALLLLYDVTNKASFDNIRAWLGEINEYAQEDVVIMLLGNKADMTGERMIRTEDGEKLAKEYNVAFMETSAKTGMNVDLAFMAVAKDLKMKKTRKPADPKFNVAEYVLQERKSGGCCGS